MPEELVHKTETDHDHQMENQKPIIQTQNNNRSSTAGVCAGSLRICSSWTVIIRINFAFEGALPFSNDSLS